MNGSSHNWWKDLITGGERMRRGKRDPARLGEQHLDPHVVLAGERQPQQGSIHVAAGEPGGGVRPGGLAHVQPPAWPAAGERRDDLLGGLVGGAGDESNPQHPGRAAVALGNGLPLFKDLAQPLRVDLTEAKRFPDGTVIHVYQPIRTMG
jgi:hypothetical protein